MNVMLFLIAIQRLLGRDRPWIPRQLRERSVDRGKLDRTLERAGPWGRRVDRVIKPQLTFLFGTLMSYTLAAIAVVLALPMPSLEVVPFAVAIPGTATLLFGLALTTRDGVLASRGDDLRCGNNRRAHLQLRLRATVSPLAAKTASAHVPGRAGIVQCDSTKKPQINADVLSS
jgi:hypothetical protein